MLSDNMQEIFSEFDEFCFRGIPLIGKDIEPPFRARKSISKTAPARKQLRPVFPRRPDFPPKLDIWSLS
jgi:hypothetical protein